MPAAPICTASLGVYAANAWLANASAARATTVPTPSRILFLISSPFWDIDRREAYARAGTIGPTTCQVPLV